MRDADTGRKVVRPASERVVAAGERSIAAQTLIAQVVNTGDYNTFFVGEYEPLVFAAINAQSVIGRVPTERSIEREGMRAEIDQFLATHDSGCFVLEAAAGLGKTTFLAGLVRDRGYVHHFVELSGDPGDALRSMATQLVRAFELAPFSVDQVLPATASTRPDFFVELLRDAANRTDGNAAVVVVVDGLDNAEVAANQNALGLPRDLPRGVYLIVSQRPVYVPLTMEAPKHVRRLEASEQANIDDLRAYLQRAALFPGVAAELARAGYTDADFVDALLRHSEGVWIYVHHVVDEIERGERSPLQLDRLPQGLWRYYAEFWRRWRDDHLDRGWYDVQRPLLASLAAVREPVPGEILARLAGVGGRPEVRLLLDERWSPFLLAEQAHERLTYRLYHASLGDFLAGNIDATRLDAADRAFARELGEATANAHARIAARYLEAWGGFADGLPGLRDAPRRDLDERYGLRNLVAHLAEVREPRPSVDELLALEHRDIPPSAGAGRWSRLLRRHPQTSPPRAENAWYLAREEAGEASGYIADLVRARRLAAAASAEELRLGGMPRSLPREIRYALMNASVVSLAANVPPVLLARLVGVGLVSPERARALALQLPSAGKRAQALASLAAEAHQAAAAELWRKAFQALSLADEFERARLLTEWAPTIPESMLEAALAAAYSLESADKRAATLADLLERVGASECANVARRVLDALAAIEDEESRAQRVADVIPKLPNDATFEALELAVGESSAARKALKAAVPSLSAEQLGSALDRVENEYYRCQLVAAVADQLPAASLPVAIAAVRDVIAPVARAQGLAGLVRRRGEEGVRELLELGLHIRDEAYRPAIIRDSFAELMFATHGELSDEALSNARRANERTSIDGLIADALAATADALGPAIVHDAVQYTIGIEDAEAIARAASALAERLQPPERVALLARARERAEAARTYSRASGLVELARGVGREEGDGLWERALAAVSEVDEESLRAQLITRLAASVPEELAPVALDIVSELPDFGRREPLAALAPVLPAALQSRALAAAVTIENESLRADVITALYPSLSERSREQALDAVNSMTLARDQALVGLAPHLPPDELLDGLFSVAENWRDKLADVVPDEALPAALDLMCAIGDEDRRARVLAAFVPALPEADREEVVSEAIELARSVTNPRSRSIALREMIPLVEPRRGAAVAEAALAAARGAAGARERVELLGELVPHFDRRRQVQVVDEAIKVAALIPEESERVLATKGLARTAPEEQLGRLLGWTRHIRDDAWRASAVKPLIYRLPAPHLREAAAIARELELKSVRAELFVALLRRSPQLADEAIAAARAVPDPNERSSALFGVASFVTSERAELMEQALDAALLIDDERARGGKIALLAGLLESDESTRALTSRLRDAALALTDEEGRFKALAALTAAAGDATAVEDALEAARAIQDRSRRLDGLVALAARLPPSTAREEALEAARSLAEEEASAAQQQAEEDELRRADEGGGVTIAMHQLFDLIANRTGPPTRMEQPPPALGYLEVRKRLDKPITSRSALLDMLYYRAGPIGVAVGESGVTETVKAIRDVGRWWP